MLGLKLIHVINGVPELFGALMLQMLLGTHDTKKNIWNKILFKKK